jgi:histidinol-phosphate/aromatic aminotransferase/cobyric acid decarboxylase-like protein
VQRNIYIRYFDLPGLGTRLRITVGTEEQNDRVILALKEIVGKSD